MKELLARVRALLRRQSRSRAIPDELQLGELQFDLRTQNATREGRAIELSTREWDMLKLLIAAKGEPVVREQFLDEVWEYNAWPTTRIVDNFIAKLRAKVEPNPTHPDFIVTVRGVGYKLQMGRPNNQE
ncbi:MAG: DNA-binding response OmpR family regulator [Akkermansiaceae bacterium]|jgi:DNA-binding response OmpR family regulator